MTGVHTCALPIYLVGSYAKVFFIRERANDADIQPRKEKLIAEFLNRNPENERLVQLLFCITANFSYDKRKEFLAIFLLRNKDFKLFASLRLEPSSRGGVGSELPGLYERAAYFESLLPLFETSELLEHRHQVEDVIQRIKLRIESAKKSDFIGN